MTAKIIGSFPRYSRGEQHVVHTGVLYFPRLFCDCGWMCAAQTWEECGVALDSHMRDVESYYNRPGDPGEGSRK